MTNKKATTCLSCVLLILSGISPIFAYAGLNKCVDNNGNTTYTDRPCNNNQSKKKIDAYGNGGNVGSSNVRNTMSIEELLLFPEKYVGNTYVFLKTELDQEIEESSQYPGYWTIEFTSPRGKSVTRFSKVPFLVTRPIVEKMLPHLAAKYHWNDASITAEIMSGNKGYYALVNSIKIYNAGGEMTDRFEDQERKEEPDRALQQQTNEATESPMIHKIRQANCDTANKNLFNLQTSGTLPVNSTGQAVRLTEEERQRRITEAKQQIKENCSH